jgi:hypothetical protein
MLGDGEFYGVEKAAFRADNVETPSTPVLTGLIILLAQFGNGFARLGFGYLKVRHLDSCVVKDRLVTVHKMKVAAHIRPQEKAVLTGLLGEPPPAPE